MELNQNLDFHKESQSSEENSITNNELLENLSQNENKFDGLNDRIQTS
jgi:hypothetical protein